MLDRLDSHPVVILRWNVMCCCQWGLWRSTGQMHSPDREHTRQLTITVARIACRS